MAAVLPGCRPSLFINILGIVKANFSASASHFIFWFQTCLVSSCIRAGRRGYVAALGPKSGFDEEPLLSYRDAWHEDASTRRGDSSREGLRYLLRLKTDFERMFSSEVV